MQLLPSQPPHPAVLDLRKHYTQQPSALRRRIESTDGLRRDDEPAAADTTTVVGSGFITAGMLEEVLAELDEPPAGALVLVDLREITGYESGCAAILGRWLQQAHRLGVRRVALVASSSVVRTATRLAAQRVDIRLETFDTDDGARRWLVSG